MAAPPGAAPGSVSRPRRLALGARAARSEEAFVRAALRHAWSRSAGLRGQRQRGASCESGRLNGPSVNKGGSDNQKPNKGGSDNPKHLRFL